MICIMPLHFIIMSEGTCGVIDPVLSHLLHCSSIFYFHIANSRSLLHFLYVKIAKPQPWRTQRTGIYSFTNRQLELQVSSFFVRQSVLLHRVIKMVSVCCMHHEQVLLDRQGFPDNQQRSPLILGIGQSQATEMERSRLDKGKSPNPRLSSSSIWKRNSISRRRCF